MKFTVEVREVWVREVEVELPDVTPRPILSAEAVKAIALQKIAEEDVDEMSLEYSETLELSEWRVRTEDGGYL